MQGAVPSCPHLLTRVGLGRSWDGSACSISSVALETDLMQCDLLEAGDKRC